MTLEQANAYLENEYLPGGNQVYGLPSMHRCTPVGGKEQELAAILSEVEQRVVTNDYRSTDGKAFSN